MRRTVLAILLITVPAAGLRLAGAFNDFWLDEVWACYIAAGAGSLRGVFTEVAVEHHILTTLYLHLVGEGGEVMHRLLSIVCGTLAVPLAGLAWIREDRRAAVAAALLTGLSFPLITYSSEVRGYAPAAFFCLGAFVLQKEYLRRRSFVVLAAFWSSLALALLANPTSVFVMAGLMAWSLARLLQDRRTPHRAAADALRLHVPPGALLALLYLALFSRWETIGGNILPLSEVLLQTLALATGMPSEGPAAVVGSMMFTAVLIAGVLVVRRDADSTWSFFPAALVVAPLLIVPVTGRVFVYPRYFAVLFPFFLLLAARVFSRMSARSGPLRVTALAAVALFAVSSLGETARFLTVGRGGYSEAVRYMAERTPSRVITVGGDHVFRNGLLLQYYQRRLPGDRAFLYVAGKEAATAAPEWYLCHSLEEDFEPSERIPTPWGVYRLERHFPFYGLSGFHWALYRRGGSPPVPQDPPPFPDSPPLR